MKPLLFSLLILFTTTVFSQTSYSYDNAGNRIARVIVLQNISKVSQNPNNEKEHNDTNEPIETIQPSYELANINNENSFKDNVGDINFNIFPNPTKGEVNIIVKNIETSTSSIPLVTPAPLVAQNMQLILTDMQGRQIARYNGKITNNTINLSNQKTGMYILTIISGKNQVVWKIVKE